MASPYPAVLTGIPGWAGWVGSLRWYREGARRNVSTSHVWSLRQDHLGRLRPAHRGGQGPGPRRPVVSRPWFGDRCDAGRHGAL